MAGQPSVKDIAKAAGVSYQTVSRVLNGGGRVSEGTRQRVHQIANDLGYRRNAYARALVTRRSHAIGVIADPSPKYGPVSTLAAVESAARAAGYTALVTTVSAPGRQALRDALEHFEESGVEGLVVIAPRVHLAQLAEQLSVDIPVVILAPGETNVPASVTVFYEDQEYGARLATRHLIEQGHRNIVHIAGSQEWLDGRVRLRGWQQELAEQRIPAPRVWYADWSGASAYRIANEIISQRRLPSGIFVASDLMALGVMRALYENGLSVPGDVSIVGFDDNEFATQTYPPLTTVRQSFAEVGAKCMEILLGKLAGIDVDATPMLPTLVRRDSVAPLN